MEELPSFRLLCTLVQYIIIPLLMRIGLSPCALTKEIDINSEVDDLSFPTGTHITYDMHTHTYVNACFRVKIQKRRKNKLIFIFEKVF